MTPEERKHAEAQDEASATIAQALVDALVSTYGRGTILVALARQADDRAKLTAQQPEVAAVQKWWADKFRGLRREYYEMRTKK